MLIFKLFNYALVNLQRAWGSRRAWGYPYYVVLDPACVCQLDCKFCDGRQRPRAVMHFEEFRRIIDQIGRTCINLELYNWGEPLLNNRLVDMIDYASRRYHIYTRISSNLNLSNDELYRALARSRLNALVVSLDGTSEETYGRYREKGSFDAVIRNIELLVASKKQYRKHEPKLVWQFLVFRHNEHEIPKAEEMARELGVDELVFRKPHVPAEAKEWDSSMAEYSNYGRAGGGGRAHCNWPYAGVAINANGSVSPCCAVAQQEDDFGSVSDRTFGDLWNNPQFQEARGHVSKGELNPAAANVCGRCTMQGLINFAPNAAQVCYYQLAPLRRILLKTRRLKVRRGA
jgi:radical SAM protein with 4Fe4S-binding SPASM domain